MKTKFLSLAALSLLCSAIGCTRSDAIPDVSAPAPVVSPAFKDYPLSQAPYHGVFRKSALNPAGGAQGNAAYAKWLNRPVMWALDYTPGATWDNIQGENWWLHHWSDWKKAVPGRRFVLTVPLLPGPKDLSGPKKGLGAGQSVSLASGARGEYNTYFQKLAENLVKYGLGDSVLRLGWEFDGNWFTWSARKDPDSFAAYFREIVKTMRAVPGAEKLQFCWNPGAGGDKKFRQESAWPGDDYVDIIGLDIYDQSWMPGTYPLPVDATPEDKEARRRKSWDEMLNGDHGLNFWRDFGVEHHKPLAFPEWGDDNRPDNHDGDDNVVFIEGMHKFITDPMNNVYFQLYFDVNAGDGHHQLSPGLDGKYQTEFPLASARFKELFSLPAKEPGAVIANP